MPRLVSLNVSKPGIYNADPNLYLIVRKGAKGPTRSWVFQYQKGSRRSGKVKITCLGLGPAHTVGLKEARDQARIYRQWLRDGLDPLQHRDAERAKRASEAAAAKTFDQVAEEYLREHAGSWVERHHANWVGTLRDHVSPVIGALPVASVDTAAVLRVLKRDDLWTTKTQTAANVRGRIERILAYAAIHGYAPIDRQNPAAWTGHLKEGLPSPKRKVEAMKSLPYAEVPALMRRLAGEDTMPAVMVMFAVHTALRSWDYRKARREHIEREARLWTIPELSKTRRGQQKGREHRVPLTDAALALVDRAIALGGDSELLFPSPNGFEFDDTFAGRLLAKLGLVGKVTLHGFRSSFRTWAAEVAEADHVVAELCLGHEVGSAVVKAYQRGDLLRRRTALMERWSAFLTGAEGKVVTLKRAKRG
jgi:integrase